MPYAGGVYSVPPGTDATTLTPVDSSDYNAFTADIEAAQNAVRPLVAGGTGASTVITAWDGLAKKGTDIATASSINLTTATGPSLSLTGTTTITGVTLAEGSIRIVRANAAFQITASVNLLCNGSASTNMSVAAEDILIFRGGAGGVVTVVQLGRGNSIVQPTLTLLQATDPAPTAEGDIRWSTLYDELRVGDGSATKRFMSGPAPGSLYGCTLSNNVSDATNDIDIAAGQAADATNARYIRLASGITKRLDANWAVGTNQGGLDTGSIANTTYHMWLIMRSDTGVVDVLFSASASAPTMPANYDYKRRIGSIIRSGGAIVGFTQYGDLFRRKTAVQDVGSAAGGTSAVTQALSVPIGLVLTAIFHGGLVDSGAGSSSHVLFTALAETDTAPSASLFSSYIRANGGVGEANTAEFQIPTDASAQIRYRVSSTSPTVFINTLGWVDTRGTV